MMSTLLLTGGTGTLGRQITPLLREAGFNLRLLSRHSRASTDGINYLTGDLLKGEGVEAAVAGADIIVHLAGGPKGDDIAARNLMQAAARSSVQHVVHISVIGADRVPLGYFKAKLGAEQAITDSGLPWTVLRAAQFHDLVFAMAEKMSKLLFIPVPGGMRFQPVDSRDVAARLVELTLGQPAGLVPGLAGPTVYGMADLLRGYLRAQGKRRLLLPIRLPGQAGRAYRAGDNLSLEGITLGKRTWEAFLAEQVR